MDDWHVISLKTKKGGHKTAVIKNPVGEVVYSAKGSTFKDVSKKLRDSRLIPTDVAINKKGDTLFRVKTLDRNGSRRPMSC